MNIFLIYYINNNNFYQIGIVYNIILNFLIYIFLLNLKFFVKFIFININTINIKYNYNLIIKFIFEIRPGLEINYSEIGNSKIKYIEIHWKNFFSLFL